METIVYVFVVVVSMILNQPLLGKYVINLKFGDCIVNIPFIPKSNFMFDIEIWPKIFSLYKKTYI